jgi:ornithine racemase
MVARATVTVDLAKIEANARTVCEALRAHGIEMVAVTKVTCGDPRVATAMLAGGAVALGESRLENVSRLRDAGLTAPVWLLRSPAPAQADDTVRLTEVSVESELATLAALDAAAARGRRRHAVVLMVDVGDLREGMLPEELPDFLGSALRFEHLDIIGIGTSLTCYGAIAPDERNLGLLARLAEEAQRTSRRKLLVSGGSSTSIHPVLAGRAPASVDNLRIGEAIVLGVDPATREPIPGLTLYTDAVTVTAPVIECRIKPSVPIGVGTQDAFGNRPVFEDRGSRRRAICALGRQDASAEGLRPLDPGVEVLGASSDHLILDVDAMPVPPAIGDSLSFVPGYSATLALFTSRYVDKAYLGEAGV